MKVLSNSHTKMFQDLCDDSDVSLKMKHKSNSLCFLFPNTKGTVNNIFCTEVIYFKFVNFLKQIKSNTQNNTPTDVKYYLSEKCSH